MTLLLIMHRTVANAFGNTGDDGREVGTITAIGKLLKQNVSVLLYAGDADYNCNLIGNEVVSGQIGAPGFDTAGYTNIKTSDHITHGQVKQSGSFGFARIYESGHEVPYYQPLAALEIFARAIKRTDIATGTVAVTAKYKTTGPAKSTYREGNSTIQNKVTPSCATYNTTTNAPDFSGCKGGAASMVRRSSRRVGRYGGRVGWSLADWL